MECAHRELRARLANRLRRNHTYRLANFHWSSGSQIASVAFDAAAPARLAGQHRANSDALYSGTLNLGRQVFVDFLIRFDDDASLDRVDNILERRATHDPISQRLDFLAAFYDSAGRNASQSSAIGLADDYVLGHVHQTPSEIT